MNRQNGDDLSLERSICKSNKNVVSQYKILMKSDWENNPRHSNSFSLTLPIHCWSIFSKSYFLPCTSIVPYKIYRRFKIWINKPQGHKNNHTKKQVFAFTKWFCVSHTLICIQANHHFAINRVDIEEIRSSTRLNLFSLYESTFFQSHLHYTKQKSMFKVYNPVSSL